MTAATPEACHAAAGPAQARRRPARGAWPGTAAAVAACVLTFLCFTSLMPVPPADGLDPSWKYAVDFGSARHMPFGQALAFTFGPLVSLYTDVRVPEHDLVYVGTAGLLTLGIFAGFLLAAHRGRRGYLLLLPVFVANLLIKDAILLALPLTLVFAACGRRVSARIWHPAFALVAVADGLLLLVKGSLILPVVACTALSCAALIRERSRWAVALPPVTGASALGTWLALGQPLAAVPAYLVNMVRVADGYTEAMSSLGDIRHPVTFVVLSLILTGLAVWLEPRHRVVTALATLAITFVSFKAGFVRQDGHATLAGAMLALMGLLLLLRNGSRVAYLGLAIGLVGWYAIASAYVPVGGAIILKRFTGKVTQSASAIALRLTDPERLFAAYRAANADIRSRIELPRLEDSIDVYPNDIAPVLASGLDWHPRPVLQSYSAYTPALATLNARHLEGTDAPEHILFDIDPIDNRFPSLEDGASWPALLSHYEFRSFSGPAALLQRTAVDHHAAIGTPLTSGAFAFGADIPIPTGADRVWASMRFHPSLTGRLLSIVFRRPRLLLDVTLTSGEQRTYRLVAGMAEGFLLSPIVRSGRDFLALSTGDPDLLRSSEVRSIRLRQESRFRLWGGSFDLTLSPLVFDPHRVGRQDLYGTSVEGTPLAQVPTGGRCSVDVVGSRALGPAGITPEVASAVVEGWATVPPDGSTGDIPVRVAMSDASGRTFYSEAWRMQRPDASRALGLPDDARIGFKTTVDLRALHGDWGLHVVQQAAGGPVQCVTAPVTIRH